MQVGGSLGTAVLGAVMAARVDDLLPRNWAAAGLPQGTPEQMAKAADAVQVGVAPVPPKAPPELAAKISTAAHDTFVSGMQVGFRVASCVAVLAAVVALFTRRGTHGEAGVKSAHI